MGDPIKRNIYEISVQRSTVHVPARQVEKAAMATHSEDLEYNPFYQALQVSLRKAFDGQEGKAQGVLVLNYKHRDRHMSSVVYSCAAAWLYPYLKGDGIHTHTHTSKFPPLSDSLHGPVRPGAD